MSRHKADWSELYPELLTSIAGRLETRDDFRHFRSVCQKWRSSIPQIPPNLSILSSSLFPFMFHATPPPFSKNDYYTQTSPIVIVANSTFLLQPLQNPNPNLKRKPLKPWLITVEELNPGKFVLRRPLIRREINQFPENFPRVLNLSNYTVTEIRKAYNFRYAEKTDVSISIDTKLILFFDPDCASPTVDDCYALVLHDRGGLLRFRLNNVKRYGYLGYSRVSCFDDIVNYKGCVWAIDRKGRVYVINYGSVLRLALYADDSVCTGYVGDTRKRLVESSEGLYLIDRYHHDELIKFKVYKLNDEERKWNEVKSLGGRILFVSTDCCFLASAEDFPGYRGDCILFPKDHFPAYYNSTYPDDYYFKGASKELEIGVFHLDDGESGLVSTFRGYSDIFWPPPKWLFADMSSSEWEAEQEETVPEEPSPSPLDLEAQSQASETPCVINGQDEFLGVDVPWADMPSELLIEIAKHLKAHIDLCRFRAVCKKWRASIQAPLSSSLLSSLLPHKISATASPLLDADSCFTANRSLVLVASTVYILRPCNQSLKPSKSWLVTVEELHAGKLFLRLPLRRFAIRTLPENFPRVLNLSDYHVSEISTDYNFRYENSSFGSTSFHWSSYLSDHKVVLFSESACSTPTIFDTTALVLYGRGDLATYSFTDDNWLPVRYGSVTKFDDVVNFKGKIYTIDRKGRAYVIICNSCSITRITGDAMGSGSGPDRQKRLVVSSGELYLVVRHSPEDKIFFRVYKLNEKLQKWDEVRSLGDKILFVTCSVCFLASARDFPGWKGNCIVFPANCLPTYSGSTYPDWRFFKRTIEELRIGVFHLGDNDGAKLVKSYPGYSDIFWPPPAWLQPLACSSRNKEEHMAISCNHSQEEELSPHSSELAVMGQTVENATISPQQDGTIATNAEPDLTPAPNSPSPVQAFGSGALTVNLEGLDIKPEHVQILLKIQASYGNVWEGTLVHNHSMMTKALESLAEAVLILKSTTGSSLDQSQNDKLCSTLSDLKLMQFRIDWLAPFVQKAVVCQISKELGSKLGDVEKRRAEILDVREKALEVLRSTAKIERKLDKESGSIAKSINSLGLINLDKCLGEGLC